MIGRLVVAMVLAVGVTLYAVLLMVNAVIWGVVLTR